MFQRLILLGAIASLPACIGGEDPGGTPEIPSDARWEAFKRSAIQISDSPVRYIFGGDMLAVGEDGLRREYERYFGSGSAGDGHGVGVATSPLTVDSVNGADVLLETSYADSRGGRFDLSYCVQRGTFSASELAAIDTALAQAQDSWSGLVNVYFHHDASQDASCSASNTNVFFNVRGVSGGAFFASSFFPHDPRSARELLIDDTAFTTTSGGRDFQGIMRHETGHTLGFRHEHIWLTGGCTGEDLGDARHVTPYDENSVMHYPQCRTTGTGGYRQSDRDYEGAVGLYGLSAALITTL